MNRARTAFRLMLPCVAAAALACGAGADPARPPAEPAPSDPTRFTQRVAVLMLADSARIEAVRSGSAAEDFEVVADDLMWYRSEAMAWLTDHDVPTVFAEGRPPLHFRVAGEFRRLDLSARVELDLVVLYDADREPLVVPTVEGAGAAEAYFGGD